MFNLGDYSEIKDEGREVNRVYFTSTYRKREHFIVVQETEGSIWAQIVSDSQGSFRPGTQIRRSTLRQMDYFREEIAPSQDVAIDAQVKALP